MVFEAAQGLLKISDCTYRYSDDIIKLIFFGGDHHEPISFSDTKRIQALLAC